MIKNKGTYTASCLECGNFTRTLIHLLDDGSISPNKCHMCETVFKGIDVGEGDNDFVFVESLGKLEVKEDTKKTDNKFSETKEGSKKTGKKSSENQSFTFKPSKKSSEDKADKKSSFDW